MAITIKSVPVTSGPAAGKCVNLVYNSKGKVIGAMQVVSFDMTDGGFCFPRLYATVQYVYPYKKKLCDCPYEALRFLRIDKKTAMFAKLPFGIYSEYWKDALRVQEAWKHYYAENEKWEVKPSKYGTIEEYKKAAAEYKIQSIHEAITKAIKSIKDIK